MSKRDTRQRKRKSEKLSRKSNRKPVITVCSLLILTFAIGIMAQWKMLPGISKPLALAPAPPTGSFAAQNPSKEYIYAGGRLIATEEPSPTPAPTPTNSATFVSQSVPSSMIAGQSYSVSVTMKNTGTSIWTEADNFRLGAQNSQDNLTWLNPPRAHLASSAQVAPNMDATFTFSVTAPTTPGTYNFQWQMVQDLVAWFGDASPNLSITVTNPGSITTENVVWRNAIGVIVSGSNLSKNAGWGWGNSGASSTKEIVFGDGYVEYTVTDAYASIDLLGLSHQDNNQDYPEMDYAIHPSGQGTLYIYENGVLRGSFGPYAAGDKLRVAIEGGFVKYSRNGVELYSHSVTPTYPLRADTAFYSPGAYVSDVVISGQLQPVPESTENIVWRNVVGVTVSGSSLSKNADWGWGNSGASSTKEIASGDGYVEYTVNDAYYSTDLLSLSHLDNNQDYPEMDYAIHPSGQGTLYIYENGVLRGSFGPYAAGDKLRVAVEGGVVKYRKNGALLYTSAVAPTYPLRADTSFYTPGAYLADAVISGRLQSVTGTTENVVWKNIVGVVVVSGNCLSKSAGWGWGNSGASSTRAISYGEGYAEFTVTDAYASISLLGLSNGDANQDYPEIKYAFHPAGNGTIYIYESGTLRGSFGSYAPGDKLRVAVEGGVVRYWKNGVLLYTSTVAPTYPLLVDTAFYSYGAYVSDVVISGHLQ